MIRSVGLYKPPYLSYLLAASLALNMLALALPLMTMQIYNRVLVNHSTDTLIVLSTGVLVAALFELILRVGRSMLVGASGAKFEHEASTKSLARLIESEPRIYSGTPVATLAQDVSSASRIKEYYGGQMTATLLVDMPFTAVFMGLIFYLTGWLGLVPCVVLAGFAYTSWRQVRSLNELLSRRESQDNIRYSFITKTLNAVHTVKALCLEALMSRRFEEVQKESGPINHKIAAINGAAGTSSYATSQMMTVAVICAGAPMVVNGYLSIGALIACVLLAGQVMQPLQRALSLWVRFQDIEQARKRLGTLLTLPARNSLPTEAISANHGAVHIENIRLSFTEGKPVLDGVSLDIEPGECVSVQGDSGCGKTTFLELLAGIYAPDKGRILLSGMEVSNIPASERSRLIAYLPAKGMILRGNIMDNLTGFDSRRQKEAHAIADLLGIEQAVATLPQGYDTPIEGLSSDMIPPGLKQRIAIGRALLFKPRLILYDNADHGLDRKSYSMIFNLLARLKTRATIVIVSDDKNIMSIADRVVEIRRGQVVQMMEPLPLMTPRHHS